MGIPSAPTIQQLYTPGTYTVTNPFNGLPAAWCELILVSGGGGGSGGPSRMQDNNANTNIHSGNGGGSGVLVHFKMAASLLHGLALTVGAGGVGGAAITPLSYTNGSESITGNNGTAGGDTVLGTANATLVNITLAGGQYGRNNTTQFNTNAPTITAGFTPIVKTVWNGAPTSSGVTYATNSQYAGQSTRPPTLAAIGGTTLTAPNILCYGPTGGARGALLCGTSTGAVNGGAIDALNGTDSVYVTSVVDTSTGTSITAPSGVAPLLSYYGPGGGPGGGGGAAAHSTVAATANRIITGGAGSQGRFPGGGGGGGGSASANVGHATYLTFLRPGKGGDGGNGMALFTWHRE